MSDAGKEPTEESIAKKERNFSPSQSDSERGNAPRDRRAETPHAGGKYSSESNSKWPYPREVADAFEKVEIVNRIPIVKNTRIFDLIAKFTSSPFPPLPLDLIYEVGFELAQHLKALPSSSLQISVNFNTFLIAYKFPPRQRRDQRRPPYALLPG